jgi:hypothetical protein
MPLLHLCRLFGGFGLWVLRKRAWGTAYPSDVGSCVAHFFCCCVTVRRDFAFLGTAAVKPCAPALYSRHPRLPAPRIGINLNALAPKSPVTLHCLVYCCIWCSLRRAWGVCFRNDAPVLFAGMLFAVFQTHAMDCELGNISVTSALSCHWGDDSSKLDRKLDRFVLVPQPAGGHYTVWRLLVLWWRFSPGFCVLRACYAGNPKLIDGASAGVVQRTKGKMTIQCSGIGKRSVLWRVVSPCVKQSIN